MYRPSFSLVALNQLDVQMTSKTISSGHTSLPAGPSLCEDGHPYVTDPVTGRKMCTCNLGTEMHFDPRALMSDARKQGMVLSGTVSGPPVGLDTSAFYSPLIRGVPVRQDNLPHYMTSSLPGQPMSFDPALASHPYGLLYAGLDVNGGPIRKAATRETTGPLKIWLSEHKKNPYPTKAEKIMLAIITRMTLTQVSTWFANARRRLKKENKLFPVDRENRDEDDDFDDDDVFNDSQRVGNTSQSEGSGKRLISDSDTEDINVDLSDCSDSDDDVTSHSSVNKLGTDILHSSLSEAHFVPVISETGHRVGSSLNSEQNRHKPDQDIHIPERPATTGCSQPSPTTAGFNKPKIWSISEIISGTSTSKGNQKQSTKKPSMTLHTGMNLSLSNDFSSTSSTLSTSQTSPSLSIAITPPPIPSPPCSSSLSSSSSPTSPTAFRPFSSLMGVPSFFQHRKDLNGIVIRYGQHAGPNVPSLDRNYSLLNNQTHLQLTCRGSISKETHIEPTHLSQPREAYTPGSTSNDRNERTQAKDKPMLDSPEVKSPKRVSHVATSNSQSTTTTSKTSWFLSTSQKTRPTSSDLNKVASPYKSTLEQQHRKLGFRNSDNVKLQTDGHQTH